MKQRNLPKMLLKIMKMVKLITFWRLKWNTLNNWGCQIMNYRFFLKKMKIGKCDKALRNLN